MNGQYGCPRIRGTNVSMNAFYPERKILHEIIAGILRSLDASALRVYAPAFQ